ncbi:MAG: hypothetical protein JW990_00395, partial [Thermoleophilia bacterium]|nr:hypothetical protein [Thermoleophilia bacterium]
FLGEGGHVVAGDARFLLQGEGVMAYRSGMLSRMSICIIVWVAVAGGCGGHPVADTSDGDAGAGGDAASPPGADAGFEADGSCPSEPVVELVLENTSVGLLQPSPDGRLLAALVNFDWLTLDGDLVVIDLQAGTSTDVIATGIPGPLVFTADSSALLYPASVTAEVYGHATWSMKAYFVNEAEIDEVCSDVVDFKMAPWAPAHVAFHTPTDTFLYAFADRTIRSVSGGEDPCAFDLESGYFCHRFTFTDDRRLVFVGSVEEDPSGLVRPSTTGTLASVSVVDPNTPTIIAQEIVDYIPSANGAAVVFASNPAFDESPSCMCPRGDLEVAATNGSFSRTLLTQARYASPFFNAAISAQGDKVAFYDPDRNPTSVTLLSPRDGTVIWSEPECKPDKPYMLARGGVLVWKSIWTGTSVDRAAEVISVTDSLTRVRIGEQLRSWTTNDDQEPARATALALTEFPYHATYYDGPNHLRLWDLRGDLPAERPAADLTSTPALNASAFDGRGENLVLLLSYHDNWRGKLVAVLSPSSELRDISSSGNAHSASWADDWVVYLGDTAQNAPAQITLARAPFDVTPARLGHSVHAYANLPAQCPVVAFADCSASIVDKTACTGAVAGIFRVTLPAQ